ncbi:esterase/lipase family protein [Pseudonocardia aurantiaca]|uniref:Esterase/lipase family protein n=1 Tax=Pseudonocardia aurantiaca TaxID=75290 RepID=A0ABW4FSE1_9PSEU
MAVEISSVVTHLVRYPTGLRCPRMTANLADRTGGSVEPIVLLPGLADNMAVFTRLRMALEDCGVGPVVAFAYSPLVGDVRSVAAKLAEQVEELCAITGASRVRLVGHSLGGLIARYYVQRLGGDARVDLVVTVATPHRGTMAAWLLPPLPLARHLRPDCELYAELAEPAPTCRTRFVTFSSRGDAVILPAGNGQLDHPDLPTHNIVLPGMGHFTMADHRLVIDEICRQLAASPATQQRDGCPIARAS